jgi:hypothetical protein
MGTDGIFTVGGRLIRGKACDVGIDTGAPGNIPEPDNTRNLWSQGSALYIGHGDPPVPWMDCISIWLGIIGPISLSRCRIDGWRSIVLRRAGSLHDNHSRIRIHIIVSYII